MLSSAFFIGKQSLASASTPELLVDHAGSCSAKSFLSVITGDLCLACPKSSLCSMSWAELDTFLLFPLLRQIIKLSGLLRKY